MKKSIVFIVICLVVLLAVAIGIKLILDNTIGYDSSAFAISKSDKEMVEKYLHDKYGLNYKMNKCTYMDNGDLGFNAGKHYVFYFDDIDGMSLNASLDYQVLSKESLNRISLNITNLEEAKELKQYIETKLNRTCTIEEYRYSETSNPSYSFKLHLDNNTNYIISGIKHGNSEIGKANQLWVSQNLSTQHGLYNVNVLTLDQLLEKMN